MVIKTIDLWTEQYKNQYECFNGYAINEIKTRIIPIQENSKLTKN